jgi:hypothetical protein
MAGPIESPCLCIICIGAWLAAVFALVTMILVISPGNCESLDSFLYLLASGGLDAQLTKFIDLSHPPKPYEICTNSEESGDPCHGMMRGDECFIGEINLLRDTHCNRCCFHLYQDGSCDGDVCLCYTNSGCIMTG